MATIKISELEEVTKLSTGDFLPIVNDNETKKVSLEQLDEMLTGGGIPEYVAEFGFNYNSSSVWWSTSGDAGSAIQAALQKALDNGEKYFKLIFRNTASGPPVLETYMYYNSSSNTLSQRQQYSVYTSSYTNEKMIYSHYVGSITDGVVGNGSTGYIWSLMTDYVPYTTTAYVDNSVSKKQDILTAGDNITIVDNVISATGGGASVDLSNYYTKEETNSAITTNLSNYSTTTQMDEALATKQPLLTAGDNITIIDNVISATGGGESSSTTTGNTEVYNMIASELNSTENLEIFTKIVNDYINSEYKQNAIVVINEGSYASQNAKNGTIICSKVYKQTDAIWGMEGYYQIQYWSSYNYEPQLCFTLITLKCTTNDDGSKTVTSARQGETHRYGLLHKENTKSYTPTADYHPATKKYVDDSIAAIDISGGSGESSVPMFSWDFKSTDATVVTMFQEWWNLFKTSGVMYPISKVSNSGSVYEGDYWFPYMEARLSSNTSITITFISIKGNNTVYMPKPTIQYKLVTIKFGDKLSNNGTVSSITVDSVWSHSPLVSYNPSGSYAQQQMDSSALSLSNTYEYTPTADYHPATKKYVDDVITSAITTVLEAEY